MPRPRPSCCPALSPAAESGAGASAATTEPATTLSGAAPKVATHVAALKPQSGVQAAAVSGKDAAVMAATTALADAALLPARLTLVPSVANLPALAKSTRELPPLSLRVPEHAVPAFAMRMASRMTAREIDESPGVPAEMRTALSARAAAAATSQRKTSSEGASDDTVCALASAPSG